MKNNWEKLARIFKLRLFEKFTLDIDRVHKFYFYFSMHGLAKIGPDGVPQLADDELKEMLEGHANVTLLEFAPRRGDIYWYWDEDPCHIKVMTIKSKCWESSFSDRQRLIAGNCFRTEADAQDGLQGLCEYMGTYEDTLIQSKFYKKE